MSGPDLALEVGRARPARPPRTRLATDRAAWRALCEAASAPYRQAGRFAWHFARGKLLGDPVFLALLERGDLSHPESARVLDIGCGQGLLASLLIAAQSMAERGQWPADWASAAMGTHYVGIELMRRDIARAQGALGAQPGAPHAPHFVCADMCSAELPASDVVVILDVLHYVGHAAQAELLARVRAAIQPHGRLLLRVGDAQQRRGYVISQWVDWLVARARGHRCAPTWGRSVAQWRALLGSMGFTVSALPMSQGTPFANVLLVCEIGQAGP